MVISKEQFLRAYEQHADAIFRYCYFRVSDKETAKDLLQTTFFKVWEYLVGGGKIRHFKPFLYRTAHNLIVDHYRRPEVLSLECLEVAGFDQEETRRVPLLDKLDGNRLLGWFAKLAPPYSEVLFMRYVEDLAVKEIAEILGETENAVSVRLHRGREKLRQLFGDLPA